MHWLLVSVLLYTFTPHVQCWGRVGHNLVARLAQSRLNEKALQWMKTHLTNHMSEISFWADSIHSSNENVFNSDEWRWSKPLHYLNTPAWSCDYVYERDCINDKCIHGALKNYSTRLMKYTNNVEHQYDFFFLVHFVGDVHQPLHAGFKDDIGGNSVSVRFMNNTVNLHSLWDTNMLTYRMRTTFESNVSAYYDYLHSKMMRQAPAVNDDNFTLWINESLDIVCKHVYFDEMNNTMNSSGVFRLNQLYYERNWPLLEERLIQAGYRLGSLLNRVLQNHNQPTVYENCTNSAALKQLTTYNILFIFPVLWYSVNKKQ